MWPGDNWFRTDPVQGFYEQYKEFSRFLKSMDA
jgi:hypothetical protein